MVKLFIGASVGYRWFRAFSITFRHISLLQRSGKSDFEHRLFLCLLDDTDATTTTTELLTMMIRQLDSRGLKNGDSLSSIVLATLGVVCADVVEEGRELVDVPCLDVDSS